MNAAASDARTIVRLDRVSKEYDEVVAVDDLDLAFAEGDFVTFLGPSGCGKTTTLRMLGGFEMPTRGKIILDGEDVTRMPPNRRDVNMVFQDYALFPHMNVERNIAFGLELKGQTRDQMKARIDTLTEFLGLSELRDRMPDQLSGGQRQRVALARALAPDPKLLLLDEPLGALDAKLRGQVQVELKGIQQRTGKTFVFVTHDQEEALTMSDRIIVMNAGRIEQDGSPQALYHHPQSRFVADFIGDTNLLDCTVLGVGGDRLALDWHGFTLHAAAPDRMPEDKATAGVAIRPESIACAEQAEALPAHLDNKLRGQIRHRIFKGARVVLDIAIHDNPAGDAVLRVALDPITAAAIAGPELWIGWHNTQMAVLRD